SEPTPAPSRRRRAGGGSRRRAVKKSSGGVPIVAWIGLAAVLVVAFGGVGTWAFWPSGDGDSLVVEGGSAVDGPAPVRAAVAAPFPVNRLPANADAYIHFRVAEAWNDSNLAGAMGSQTRFAIGAAIAPYGLTVADVESVTRAGPFVMTLAEGLDKAANIGADAPLIGQQTGQEAVQQFVGVVRLSKDFDLAAIAPEGEPLFEPMDVSASEGTLYTGSSAGPQMLQNFAVWQADGRTLIFGSQDQVREIATNSSNTATRPGFAGAAGGTLQFLVAPEEGMAVLPSRERMETQMGEAPTGEELEFAERYAALQEHAAGAGFAFDLDATPMTVTFTLPALRPDDSAAVAALEDAATFWTENMTKQQDGSPSVPPAVLELIEEFLQSATQTTEDGVVTVTFTAPADFWDRIKAIAGG
ncbi:MAG: hypothetical protein AAF907_08745, partial [Planctomycetota bacterium]